MSAGSFAGILPQPLPPAPISLPSAGATSGAASAIATPSTPRLGSGRTSSVSPSPRRQSIPRRTPTPGAVEREKEKFMQVPDALSVKKLINVKDRSGFLRNLQNLHENGKYRSDMDLKRSAKCTCTKDEPCTLISPDDILSLLIEQKGECKSCSTELAMYNLEDLHQRINVYALTTYRPQFCKTRDQVKKLFCRACHAMVEICHYDSEIFNNYRSIIFEAGDAVDANYFPRLERIDDRNRYIWLAPNKKAGAKKIIYKQWLKQQGFVVYPLPTDLIEPFKKQGGSCKIAATMNNLIKDKIYDKYDENILEKQVLVQSGKKEKPKVAAEKKEEKKTKKKSKARGITVTPAELYENLKTFVVFRIPIEPRRTLQKKSLSAIALTSLSEEDKELRPENVLLTTRLLSGIEKSFSYRDFICWALDCCRISMPTFENVGGSFAPEMDEKFLDITDHKKLEILKKISIEEKDLRTKSTELKKQHTEIKKQRTELERSLVEKLLPVFESNGNLEVLDKYNLQAGLINRQPLRKTVNRDYIASRLPSILKRKFSDFEFPSRDKMDEACIEIAAELFDVKSRVAGGSKGVFTIKYIDPDTGKKKYQKEKKAQTASVTITEKKKKAKEEEEKKTSSASTSHPAAPALAHTTQPTHLTHSTPPPVSGLGPSGSATPAKR